MIPIRQLELFRDRTKIENDDKIAAAEKTKLLAEIDHAIEKIDTGEYGFCEGTGEVIPKRRLELRPWCRHSVKYKEQLERMKKSGRGVADEDEAF